MDQPTLKFLESQLQAAKDFMAYAKHMDFVIYSEFAPGDYLKIARGLKKIVSDDKTADKKWARDTLYAIEGLFSNLPNLQKRVKYANDKVLRESIKSKKPKP